MNSEELKRQLQRVAYEFESKDFALAQEPANAEPRISRAGWYIGAAAMLAVILASTVVYRTQTGVESGPTASNSGSGAVATAAEGALRLELVLNQSTLDLDDVLEATLTLSNTGDQLIAMAEAECTIALEAVVLEYGALESAPSDLLPYLNMVTDTLVVPMESDFDGFCESGGSELAAGQVWSFNYWYPGGDGFEDTGPATVRAAVSLRDSDSDTGLTRISAELPVTIEAREPATPRDPEAPSHTRREAGIAAVTDPQMADYLRAYQASEVLSLELQYGEGVWTIDVQAIDSSAHAVFDDTADLSLLEFETAALSAGDL